MELVSFVLYKKSLFDFNEVNEVTLQKNLDLEKLSKTKTNTKNTKLHSLQKNKLDIQIKIFKKTLNLISE